MIELCGHSLLKLTRSCSKIRLAVNSFHFLNFVDQGDMAAALRAFNRGVRLLFTVSLKVEDREQLADHKPLTKNIDHIKLKGTDLFKEAMSQDFCIFFLQ